MWAILDCQCWLRYKVPEGGPSHQSGLRGHITVAILSSRAMTCQSTPRFLKNTNLSQSERAEHESHMPLATFLSAGLPGIFRKAETRGCNDEWAPRPYYQLILILDFNRRIDRDRGRTVKPEIVNGPIHSLIKLCRVDFNKEVGWCGPKRSKLQARSSMERSQGVDVCLPPSPPPPPPRDTLIHSTHTHFFSPLTDNRTGFLALPSFCGFSKKVCGENWLSR